MKTTFKKTVLATAVALASSGAMATDPSFTFTVDTVAAGLNAPSNVGLTGQINGLEKQELRARAAAAGVINSQLIQFEYTVVPDGWVVPAYSANISYPTEELAAQVWYEQILGGDWATATQADRQNATQAVRQREASQLVANPLSVTSGRADTNGDGQFEYVRFSEPANNGVVAPVVINSSDANKWRFENATRTTAYTYKGITVDNVRVYVSPNRPGQDEVIQKTIVDGRPVYRTLTDSEVKALEAKIDGLLTPKAEEKKKRKPNAAVAGAIAINILAEEFINPHLAEEGVSVGATVGGSADLPETAIGVSKNLGDGWSANLGVTTDTAQVSVGVNKSVDVSDNVRVGAGVGYSEAGWNVGPSVQFHDGEGNGVGVTGFGAIPTITVQGYTVAVVPQLFVPNLIVVGAQIGYKWIKGMF